MFTHYRTKRSPRKQHYSSFTSNHSSFKLNFDKNNNIRHYHRGQTSFAWVNNQRRLQLNSEKNNSVWQCDRGQTSFAWFNNQR